MRHLAQYCATCGHRGDVHSGDYCRHLECTSGMPGACAGCAPLECSCPGFAEPVEAEEVHPPPEVPAREVEPADEVVPGGARVLLNLGKKHGWAVERFSYARGTSLDAYGKPSTVKDHVALRMRRGDQVAIGTWTNGTATSFYWNGVGQVSVAELKAHMRHVRGEAE